MLPTVDARVFAANPGFEKLYSALINDVLNPDGSTKNDHAAQQREANREALKEHRLKATKEHLLKNAIATVPTTTSQAHSQQHAQSKSQVSKVASQKTPQLPSEILGLLFVLPPFLEQAETLGSDDQELLLSSPPFSDFASLLPQLCRAVSSQLSTQARGLARVLHPTTNPSFIHRAVPHLLPTTQALLSTLSTTRDDLTAKRLAVVSSLIDHLDQHTNALVLLLRALEAKHGPVAQSSTLRASDASLEAQLWAASLNLLLWETRSHVYPPESQTALRNYRHHLRDAQMQLSNKLRTREQELGEYGVFVSAEDGGVGVGKADEAREHKFREMARIWKEMEKRLNEINGDLERLSRS